MLSTWKKRALTLPSGVVLIELDYLHEGPSILKSLPSYPHKTEAKPYTGLVNDPYPTHDEGITQIYLCGVNDPLPIIETPLLLGDYLAFDLEAA